MDKRATFTLGKKGEDFVARWLALNGYYIVARNYRSKVGEIDLIAKKRSLIAFVEVKARRKEFFPISTVITTAKKRRLIKTAENFIVKFFAEEELIYRFDVAIILFDKDEIKFDYFEDAFSL